MKKDRQESGGKRRKKLAWLGSPPAAQSPVCMPAPMRVHVLSNRCLQCCRIIRLRVGIGAGMGHLAEGVLHQRQEIEGGAHLRVAQRIEAKIRGGRGCRGAVHDESGEVRKENGRVARVTVWTRGQRSERVGRSEELRVSRRSHRRHASTPSVSAPFTDVRLSRGSVRLLLSVCLSVVLPRGRPLPSPWLRRAVVAAPAAAHSAGSVRSASQRKCLG